MKLVRFGNPGHEKPGIIDGDGRRRDCSSLFHDWDSGFFRNGGLNELKSLMANKQESLPVVPDDVRHGPCVARPGKIICIGLNYSDHAAEAGLEMPKEPMIFLKAPNTTVGPYDDILLPRRSSKVDWEVELGVIVGQEARYLPSEAAAEECIAGYCISHDVSERSFQFDRGGQWTKGKSCDTFNPLGPWLLTRDECSNSARLRLSLEVNGVPKQEGSTATMAFGPAALIHYLSQFMTLEAGDLISTGTPPGVGFARKPQEFLREGDVVTLSIEGLGIQRQMCRLA
ncbi:MAG: fumarylacetoacetate hydrolase family protein [Phycisphaerales bacterium]|jgi:2-keto-4-pentenoate hydratase/2-oxohepta-3-ene-1,7-dioic acid hydratase in catechol pathway|nr:fumarylacetoacetate hydrolase family protein [Phycisphaerales bacterium]